MSEKPRTDDGKAITIPADVRYTCITCGLTRTLTFAGEQQWLGPALTQPFCRKCGDPMTRQQLT